ncbi:MAG TPA: hypothetical protein VEH31_44225 [Streptosporangiaceae bacterium]|nr:hypothetical protein [Streptosporangiaceae bacterium]
MEGGCPEKARVHCGINTGPRRAAHPTCDPGARFEELGPDYYRPRSPARQTRDKIREIERLNPGKKVILAPIGAEADTAA